MQPGGVIRSPGQLWTAWGFGGFMILLGASQASRGQPGTLVLLVVLGLAFIALFAWRTGLWITPLGIRVRNPFESYELRWDQISGFRIGRHGRFRASCLVDLADGSTRYVFAVQVMNRSLGNPKAPEHRIVAELNDQLARRR